MILLLFPLAIQGGAMILDEAWFHRRRGLPRWERIGHPLDTLTVLICFLFVLFVPPNAKGALAAYIALAGFSSLFITKDEWVHSKMCEPAEHWLHAILFVLHPIVFFTTALLWRSGARTALWVQAALIFGFGLYQLLYWSFLWKPHRP